MFSSKTLTLELQLPAGQILVNLVKNNFTDSKIIPEQNLGFKTIIFAIHTYVCQTFRKQFYGKFPDSNSTMIILEQTSSTKTRVYRRLEASSMTIADFSIVKIAILRNQIWLRQVCLIHDQHLGQYYV